MYTALLGQTKNPYYTYEIKTMNLRVMVMKG